MITREVRNYVNDVIINPANGYARTFKNQNTICIKVNKDDINYDYRFVYKIRNKVD